MQKLDPTCLLDFAQKNMKTWDVQATAAPIIIMDRATFCASFCHNDFSAEAIKISKMGVGVGGGSISDREEGVQKRNQMGGHKHYSSSNY